MGETRINISEWCQLPLLSLGKVTVSIIYPVSRARCQQLQSLLEICRGGGGTQQKNQRSEACVSPQAESLIISEDMTDVHYDRSRPYSWSQYQLHQNSQSYDLG